MSEELHVLQVDEKTAQYILLKRRRTLSWDNPKDYPTYLDGSQIKEGDVFSIMFPRTDIIGCQSFWFDARFRIWGFFGGYGEGFLSIRFNKVPTRKKKTSNKFPYPKKMETHAREPYI